MTTETNQVKTRTIEKINSLAEDYNSRIVDQHQYKEQLLVWIRFRDETEFETIVRFFEDVEKNIQCDNEWYKSNVQIEKNIVRANSFLLIINLGVN